MRILTATDRDYPQFESIFEEVEQVGIEDIAPAVMDGEREVKINGFSIEEFDAAFVEIPAKNAVFGRVMLEMVEEKGVRTNYPSTGFFIMAKKNYLHYTLQERGIAAPKTAVIGSDKTVRNLEKEIEFPVSAYRFDDLSLVENQRIESQEEAESFAEGMEYAQDVIVFQELEEGEKYKTLVAGDQMISLADKTEGWRVSNDNLQYSSLPKELREEVRKTADSIGTPVAEIVTRAGKVIDVNPNPDLEIYTERSGKNAFEAVAKVLGSDNP